MSTRNKSKTPEQKIREHAKEIVREINHWEYISQNGCNDPFWADGTNMNLTRSHIIYAKEQIAKLCNESKLPLPPEYYFPLPPIVDEQYMANTKDNKRVGRIKIHGDIHIKKPKYNHTQLKID